MSLKSQFAVTNRRAAMVAVTAVLLLGALLAAGYFVASGPLGERWARARLVRRLEQMTGGRVEVRTFRWNLASLEVEAEGITIHGLPPQGSQISAHPMTSVEAANYPWLHVERMDARMKIFSLLRRQIGLQALMIERPVLRIIIYPDGTSNTPKPRAMSGGDMGELFDLAAGTLEVREGRVIVNERSLPLDAVAEQVRVRLATAGKRRFQGSAEAASVEVRYSNLLKSGPGTMKFSIEPDQAIIESAVWGAGESRFEASGKLVNFANPQLTIAYTANLKLDQLAKLDEVKNSELKNLRGGTVSVKGTATYARRQLAVAGNIAARGVNWMSRDLAVQNINLGSEYRIDRENATFPNVFATMLGGTVNGLAEVRNWRAFEGATSRQQGSAKLHVVGMDLGNLAAASANSSLPLDKLKLRGRSSGEVEINWSGKAETAQARFNLNVASPPVRAVANPESVSAQRERAAGGDLPLSGRARGTYVFRSSTLQLDALDLEGPSMQLGVTGALAAKGSNARLRLSTNDIAAIAPLVQALSPRLVIPQGTTGEGSFAGTLTGSMKAPTVVGRLEGKNIEIPMPAPAGKSQAQSPRLRFDSAGADIRLSPDMLGFSNTTAQQGKSRFAFNGSARLSEGELIPSSLLQGRLTVRDGEIAELQLLGGRQDQYPASGTVNTLLQIGGTWSDPRAAGRVRITNGVFIGQPFQSLEATLLVGGGEITLDNLSMEQGSGRINGTLAYNWHTRGYRAQLAGSGFELGRVRQLQKSRLILSGQVDWKLHGEGTLDRPSIDGDARVQNLAVNGEKLGGITLEGTTSEQVLHVMARSQFSSGQFTLGGTIGLQHDFPAQLDLKLERVDVDGLLAQLLKGNITGHSAAEGTLRVEGPLRTPALLAMKGSFDQVSASVEGVRLSNSGPVEFQIRNQVLTLSQVKLVGQGTEITATGTAELKGRQRLNLNARGDVNLKLLQSFNPKLNSSGMANIELQVQGTASIPDARGRVTIQNGAITHVDLPNGLSDINGTLMFNQDRMEVESLTARSGGGEVVLGGFVNIGSQREVDLTARGREVRLRYPQGISSILNLDLHLTGGGNSYTLAGSVTVSRVGITPQFDLGYYMIKMKQPAQPDVISALNRLHLNLHVVSSSELQLDTSAAKLAGDVDFDVRGTAQRPVLLGRVNISEGEITHLGTRYQVNHADFTFSNPVRIEPVFDAELTTRVREYDVTLNFHGPPDRLSTTYRSEPPLPSADVVGLLATGQTRAESAQVIQPATTFTENEAQAFLGNALNAAVSDRVQKLLGVSRIRFSPPETVGAQTNPTARVTIEQQVARNVTLTYVTNLSQSSQQIIQMEYNVNRSVSVVATRDQNGIVSLDFRLRQRKK